MTETKRPFKHRHTDSDARSRIREEARKVRGQRHRKLRKRYATLLLGASMALGGLGIPLKAAKQRVAAPPSVTDTSVFQGIGQGLEGIADGVTRAAENVSSPEDLINAEEAAEQIASLTEEAREQFFRDEVPFGPIIWEHAQRNDVEPELVAAMVQQESRFKPRAKSPVGAMGLMQLMPRTGAWMGATNLYDPVDNVKAGTKYLKYLNKRFGGDETLIVAAYNGGEGNVKKYGGIPPFKETRDYVKKVNKYKQEFQNQVAEAAADYIAEQNPVLAELAR